MAKEFFGFDIKVRPQDHSATHYARRMEPLNRIYPVQLLTACGLWLPVSELENRLTPRKCDACLRRLMEMARG